MKKIITSILLLMSCWLLATSQPNYDMNRLRHEKLSRGVVAIRQDSSTVIISWRTLATDKKNEPYNVFRNGVRMNAKELVSGGTFFIDKAPLTSDATYEIRGGSVNGTYTLKAHSPIGYIPIRLNKPADGVANDGRHYSYTANDASIGDVDGDGDYEIILKWDPTNAADNSRGGFTGNVFFDCYKLSGEQLWRIDMGKNIRAGAHYTQFLVYDFDGDGRAEIMMKTCDGTRDGQGVVIGDSAADYREPANDDHDVHGDNKSGRILSGPEYLSVFDGQTGAVLCTTNYIPERGLVSSWGDDYGNRCDRFLACVAYLDGIHPCAVMCRGYYTRTVLAAWNWNGKELESRWVFDTDNEKWKEYAGQGNHNLRVADVDGDGCDEIMYGSMAVDHDGTGLYNTKMGHGDAMHLTAFDPQSKMLQVWDCHENRIDGTDFRDAKTGHVIFQIKNGTDVGRCMAADIDPNNPGVEMWSTESGGIRNLKGELIKTNKKENLSDDDIRDMIKEDNTTMPMPYRRGLRMPTNFGIWWDGDLLREMLDKAMVSKYNWKTGQMDIIQKFDGCKFNNWTKQNPNLSADIIGDWREEVVTRTADNDEMRVYVSTIPTNYRMNCLEEDIPYRLGVADENIGYNQPPETGFYLGPDKTVNPFLK